MIHPITISKHTFEAPEFAQPQDVLVTYLHMNGKATELASVPITENLIIHGVTVFELEFEMGFDRIICVGLNCTKDKQ